MNRGHRGSALGLHSTAGRITGGCQELRIPRYVLVMMAGRPRQAVVVFR